MKICDVVITRGVGGDGVAFSNVENIDECTLNFEGIHCLQNPRYILKESVENMDIGELHADGVDGECTPKECPEIWV